QISISLVNTSNKNIDNLEIKLPLNVLTDDIFVSQPIIINKLNTNYGNIGARNKGIDLSPTEG
ncbi:hypothetical protein, partial [Peribacillus simplex]|uniref:hypothetical protein n=2 Tax=Bacillales TaxID=1385 RepID=UPI001C870F97